jgi:hypothetical protein
MFNKFYSLAFILFVFAFSFSSSFPQDKSQNPNSADSSKTQKIVRMKMTLHSAPKLTIQFSGSYDFGVYELSGNSNGDFNSNEFVQGMNFGVRHGIGANLTAKYPLHEHGNLRLDVSLLYNRFSSSLTKVMSVNDEVEFAKYNVFSFVAGIENNFTPSYKIKTYVGAGITASIISGQAKIFSDGAYNDLSIIPAFRLGVSLFSGLEYMINDRVGFNAGFMFTHANLWLKNSKESSDPGSIYLNDARVQPRLPFSGFKQFAWGSFFTGINYYFGISDKQYVYPKH